MSVTHYGVFNLSRGFLLDYLALVCRHCYLAIIFSVALAHFLLWSIGYIFSFCSYGSVSFILLFLLPFCYLFRYRFATSFATFLLLFPLLLCSQFCYLFATVSATALLPFPLPFSYRFRYRFAPGSATVLLPFRCFWCTFTYDKVLRVVFAHTVRSKFAGIPPTSYR